jgi:Mg-chelatase subunit ChlD
MVPFGIAVVLGLLVLGVGGQSEPALAQEGACNVLVDQKASADALLLGESVEVEVSLDANCGDLNLAHHFAIVAQPWPAASSADALQTRDSLLGFLERLDFGQSRIGLVLGNSDPTQPTATPRPAPLPTALPNPGFISVALTQNRFLLQQALGRFAATDAGVNLDALFNEARALFVDAELADRNFYGRRHIIIVGHAGAPIGRSSTLDFNAAIAGDVAIDMRWYCIGGGCQPVPGIQIIDVPDAAAVRTALEALIAEPAPLSLDHVSVASEFSATSDYVFNSAAPPADQMGRLVSNYIRWDKGLTRDPVSFRYALRPIDGGSGISLASNVVVKGVSTAGREISSTFYRPLWIDVGAGPAEAGDCKLRGEVRPDQPSLALDSAAWITVDLVADCADQPQTLDVVLAIDSSASMLRGRRLEDAKDAARTFVNAVDLSLSRVSLLSVGSSAEILIEMSSDRVALIAAIDSLTAAGENDFGDAFNVARDILTQRRPEALPAIVLLSDGATTFPTALLGDPWLQAGFWAHLEGIRSVVVCVTDQSTCRPEFRQLASPSSYFKVSGGGADLRGFYAELASYLTQADFERLSLTHIPNPAFRYSGEPGGHEPPLVGPDGRLTWQRADPLFGRASLRYPLRADAVGTWPVAERIEASWRQRDGRVGRASLSLPEIEVVPPDDPGNCQLIAATNTANPSSLALNEQLLHRLGAELSCTESNQRLDVVLVLDHSDSMSGQRMDAVRQAVEALLNRPGGAGLRYGLVAFSGQILAELPLSDDRDALIQRLRQTTPAGETNIGQALNRAKTLLDQARPDARAVVILITDGRNSVDPQTILSSAATLNDQADLIAACIGAACDPELALAPSRESYYFELAGDAQVGALFDQLGDALLGLRPSEISLESMATTGLLPASGFTVPPLTSGPNPQVWTFGFPVDGSVAAEHRLEAVRAGRQPLSLWSRLVYRSLSGDSGTLYLPPAAVEVSGGDPVAPTALPLPTATPGGLVATSTPIGPGRTPTAPRPLGEPIYLPWLSNGN